MLANTFCHIRGVSPAKERALWEKGVHTWDDYRPLSRNPAHLDNSIKSLQERDPSYFSKGMKPDQHWRLFPDFRESVAYVDIETTGLDKRYDEITTIALYDGKDIFTYINGKNLHDFKNDICNYKLLVTFNGKCFDVPFIENYFSIKLPHAHIDLRWVLKKLGYSGGLKAIERQIGIDRGDLRSVDGFFAVMLWNQYVRKKDESALETLLAYNCADVVNLEVLMVEAYNENVKQTPFGDRLTLPTPDLMEVPYRADTKVMRRLMGF